MSCFEDHPKLVKVQPLSTSGLGKALIHRLQRGDMLSSALSYALCTVDILIVLGGEIFRPGVA